MKPIDFLGDALERLREFPLDARRDAGHQLWKLQQGLKPDDWKPMRGLGGGMGGVSEIRI
ncbi:MAG: type II toxin-antitoxin system RelE/ParE family toxin [Acidithiobacillus sp.]